MGRALRVALLLSLATCVGNRDDEYPNLQLARWSGNGEPEPLLEREISAAPTLGVADMDGDSLDEVLCGSVIVATDGTELALDERMPADVAILTVGATATAALYFDETERIALFTCARDETELSCSLENEIDAREFTYDLAAADLDGDGIDELLIWASGGVAMHRLDVSAEGIGLGPASLIVPSSSLVPAEPGMLDAGDVDDDGAMDLAFVSAEGVHLVYGDGMGGFFREEVYPWSGGTGGVIALCDIDGNGLLDPVLASAALLQHQPGDFETMSFSPDETSLIFSSGQPACADFDTDGRDEIVAVGFAEDDFGLLTFTYNDADPGFTSSVAPIEPWMFTSDTRVAAGRFDRTAGPELAIFSRPAFYGGC